MKKPSSKIRDEIAKLEEQLKVAEKRDAERIGRVALKAGLGDMQIEEADLLTAFEELSKRFRGGKGASNGGKRDTDAGHSKPQASAHADSAAQGNPGEA